MRRTLALLVIALGLLSPGCAVIQDGVRVVSTDLQDGVVDTRERHRNRKLAEAAWKEIAGTDACKYSADHGQGFVEGFADYLFWGKEEPPVVPPARYRGFRYQTPQGYQASEDWFAGYRHGVAVAIASGYRRLVTGPVSTALPHRAESVFILPGEPIASSAKIIRPTFPANQGVSLVAEPVPAARFGTPLAWEPDAPATIGVPLTLTVPE
jgi:hypothetical protein